MQDFSSFRNQLRTKVSKKITFKTGPYKVNENKILKFFGTKTRQALNEASSKKRRNAFFDRGATTTSTSKELSKYYFK